MALNVKIEFNGSKRLLKSSPETFEELQSQIYTRFSSYLPNKILVRYKDPEDEWIRISTTEDLLSAYTYIQSLSSLKSITFVISEDLNDSESDDTQELTRTIVRASNKKEKEGSLDESMDMGNSSILKPLMKELGRSEEFEGNLAKPLEKEEAAQKILENEAEQKKSQQEAENVCDISEEPIKDNSEPKPKQQELPMAVEEEEKKIDNLEVPKQEEGEQDSKPETVQEHLKHFFECLLKAKPKAGDLQGLGKTVEQEQVDIINEVINSKLRLAFEASFYEKKFSHVLNEKKEENSKEKLPGNLINKQETAEKAASQVNKRVSFSEIKNIKHKCKVITCPDNLQVEPDTPITAYFIVQNTGEACWPKDLFLIGSNGWDDKQVNIPVAELAVMDKQEIEVNMVSPKKDGVYLPSLKLTYKNADGSQTQFGPKLSFEVKVRKNSSRNDCSITCEKKKDLDSESNSLVLNMAASFQRIFPDKDQKHFIQFVKNNNLQNEDLNNILEMYIDK